jgi:hypothetical protein
VIFKEEFDDKKPHSLTLPPDVRPKENIQPAPYQPPKLTYSQDPVTNQSFQLMTSSSLRCLAPYNSLRISTPLAALPYMLSSVCSNYPMEASGPTQVATSMTA